MKNSILLLFALCLFSFISCTDSGEPKTEEPATTTETPVSVDEQELAPAPIPLNAMIRAKYVSAAVYAAATDYVFVLDDKQQITITVSDVEGAENPDVPAILLESGEELDGPPGANPALVGKYLTIEQDQSGNYVRVIYSQGKQKAVEE
ncbi:MAG: hypothetical protein ACI8P3_001009 [Saprospiraceae bacterium]|jgi:hypothetical protein